MIQQRLYSIAALTAVAVTMLPSSAVAEAAPLSLYQLSTFEGWLGCLESGVAPETCGSPNAVWDKNLDGAVDKADYALAVREYWDDGELTYICYKSFEDGAYTVDRKPESCEDDCAVVPHSLCDPGAAECLADDHTEEECEDVDGDKIRRWQEDLIGSSDYVANDSCDIEKSPETCGFTQQCKNTYDDDGDPETEEVSLPDFIDNAICMPRRDCEEGECTVFHLETASVNNNELIVYVVFDYAPIPPTVIDLYIDYDFNYLTLIDARMLKVPCADDASKMCDIGKELTVGHPVDNRMRLTVLSPSSVEAVPSGYPIIELVFDRIASGQTSVAFTNQDKLQTMALAPDQGEDANGELIRNQLADDDLWGAAVEVPAADPRGPRLLLYYSFDNPRDFQDYADVKDGAELCAMMGSCSVLDDNDDYEREQKEIIQAKLNVLQRGRERVSKQVDYGVIGPAGFMNGRTDHMELPITVNDPARDPDGHYYYGEKDQSFSLSMWFYSEDGAVSSETDDVGQILFSRNNAEEDTKFGVALKSGDLYWFDGMLEDASSGSFLKKKIISVAPLTWTHFGMVLHDTVEGVDDDGDGLTDEMDPDEYDWVNFYKDGKVVSVEGETEVHGVDDDHDGETDEEDEKVIDFLLVGSSGAPQSDETAFEMTCPGIARAGGLTLHEEGKAVPGVLGDLGSPEVLFYASAENNQYGIETMDLYGIERTELLRDGTTSAKEVDYSPLLDKLVYSSNASGNYEIWIADGDGTNPRQITEGFGDTSLGIFARRPKWAPDGTAIVFDSNAFSLEYMDNLRHQVYHLYYIEYDRVNNEVAVPLEDGGTSTVLDYNFILANQTVSFYRLSSGTDYNSYGAVWVHGKNSDGRGRLWFNSSFYKHNGKEIRTFNIPNTISGSAGVSVFGNSSLQECITLVEDGTTAPADLEIEHTLMDGYRINTSEYGEQAQIVFQKQWVAYEAADTYADRVGKENEFFAEKAAEPYSLELEADDDDTDSGGEIVDAYMVEVSFTANPANYPDGCWDVNNDGNDTTDDLTKDEAYDWRDCVQSEISELYLRYDAERVRPVVSESEFGDEITDSGSLAKSVKVTDYNTTSGDYVRLRASSEVNNRPIVVGEGEAVSIASVPFVLVSGTWEDAGFTLEIRSVNQRIGLADMGTDGLANRVGELHVAKEGEKDVLEFVKDAKFSPDGNRLVLHGIENARPVVLIQEKVTPNLLNGENYYNEAVETPRTVQLSIDGECGKLPEIKFLKISSSPMNVDGMSWEKIERYYPCNWMGANKERDSKLYQNAFNGGMDELRLYSYPRDPRGFLSDYERGHAWLEKEGRDGTLKKQDNSCSDSTDCPDYMQCNKPLGECEYNDCSDDNPCEEGVCTLMAVPAGVGQSVDGESILGSETYEWVCVSDCVADNQCFMEECLNGPCRYCDNNSCEECRWGVREISGTLGVNEIQGCPDRNSWDCVDGSCVTECYEFDNGQSIYLCDPAVEYCSQGRCKLFDWDWTDLAPATFSSIGDMVFDTIDTTTAIDQNYPVEITAYGVEDYLHPPELLVEGSSRDQFGGFVYNSEKQWFKVGQVLVYNKDKSEAAANPYTVFSPVPLSDVRIRLVQPVNENPSVAATGYGTMWDGGRSNNGECAVCTNWYVPVGTDVCKKPVCLNWSASGSGAIDHAPGSRAALGYPVGIPVWEQRKACADHARGNCNYSAMASDPLQDHLKGGKASVIVLEVKVAGTTVDTLPITETVDDEEVTVGRENRTCAYVSVNQRDAADGYIIQSTSVAGDDTAPMFYQDFPLANGSTVTVPLLKKTAYGTAELSNERTFYDGAYDSDTQNNTQLNKAESDQTWAVLNCNYNGGQNETSVAAHYQVCPRDLNECFTTLYPTMGRDGAIFETEAGCAVERGMRRTPCYEFTGNEVTLDFMTYTSDSKEVWHTLDFDLHRSFGYDEGSLKETADSNEAAVPVL